MKTARLLPPNIPLFVRIGALYVIGALSILITASAVSDTSPAVYASETPPALRQQAAAVAAEHPEISGMPVALSVDRLGVSLGVKPGAYNAETKEWTLDTTHAFYVTTTQLPGTVAGTTFLYGHNRASAFGPLSDVRSGDVAEVVVESGATLVYEYARDVKVSPEYTQILKEKSDVPQLVLMTCEGLLSDARRIMYFTLKDVR